MEKKTVRKSVAVILTILLLAAAGLCAWLYIRANELRAEVNAKSAALEAAETRLEEADAAIAGTETPAEENAAESDMESERISSEAEELRSRLEGTEAELEAVTSELTETKSQLEKKGTELEDITASLADAQALLESTGAELENMTALQTETAASLADAQALLESKSAELESMTALQAETAASLAGMQELLENKDTELSSVTAQHAEMAASLADTQTLLENKDAELNSVAALQAETAASLADTQTLLESKDTELDNMAVLQEETAATLTETRERLQRAATLVLASDKGPGSSEPAESYISIKNESDITVTADYTFKYPKGNEYRHVMYVKNTSGKNLTVRTSTTVYNKEGKIIAWVTGGNYNLPADSVGIANEQIFRTEEEIGFYKTEILTFENCSHATAEDIEITAEEVLGGVRVWVTNTSGLPLASCSGTVVFYRDGKIVAYKTKSYAEGCFQFDPGASRYSTFTAGTEFEDYEIFFDVSSGM